MNSLTVKPLLIIITGLPGTGKSALGKKLAEELQLPFISKDDFKELLFESLGWEDREWSKKLGAASYDMLYHVTESILKVDKSMIIETNFHPIIASNKLCELKAAYGFEPFQILCHTEGDVLFERFKKRAESGNRHEGHRDIQSLQEWKPILSAGKIEALNIGGELYEIDTTHFETIDFESLKYRLQSALALPISVEE